MLKQIPIIFLISLISLILMFFIKFFLRNESQEISPLEGIVVTKDGWSLGTKDIIIFCSTLIILSKLTKNMNIKVLGIDISWNNVSHENQQKIEEKKKE